MPFEAASTRRARKRCKFYSAVAESLCGVTQQSFDFVKCRCPSGGFLLSCQETGKSKIRENMIEANQGVYYKMTKEEVYEHLAQVYLGKKSQNKNDFKKNFSFRRSLET